MNSSSFCQQRLLSILLLISLLILHLVDSREVAAFVPHDHRSFRIWNHTTNSLQQLSLQLPSDAPFLVQPNFLSSYSPISASNPLIDHTQGQLRQLLDIFGNKTGGIFVDLATNDWIDGSNTVDFERYFNWSGICIEPNRKYWAGILSNRKCHLVTSPVFSENNVMIKFNLADGHGGIVAKGFDNEQITAATVDMPTVTLERIVDDIYPLLPTSTRGSDSTSNGAKRVIDYLSLDVEGAEFPVLSHFNFTRTVFLVMTIERPKHALHMLLTKHGYWWLNQARSRYADDAWGFGDMIYIHESAPRFTELMNRHRREANPSYIHQRHKISGQFFLHPAWPPQTPPSDSALSKST